MPDPITRRLFKQLLLRISDSDFPLSKLTLDACYIDENASLQLGEPDEDNQFTGVQSCGFILNFLLLCNKADVQETYPNRLTLQQNYYIDSGAM